MNVLVTGATGYMGRRLIERLSARGHRVRALVRPGSEAKAPRGCEVVVGDALRAATFASAVPPCDTLVHLVGVAHPSPAKAEQFVSIDLASVRASVEAATAAGVGHLVYVSVAQPAPVMKAYVAARARAEETIRASGMHATLLRPWYVLGPGHRWPVLLIPGYWLAERIPAARETARRLGLVTIEQMVSALVEAVEDPCEGLRIWDAPRIRSGDRR